MSAKDVLREHRRGRRDFKYVDVVGSDLNLSGADLEGARFYCGSLRYVDLSGAHLTHTQFKGADLTGANLSQARINATDLIGAKFVRANLSRADLTGAALQGADCRGADFRKANFGNCRLSESLFEGARLDGIYVSSTDFSDLDVTEFCEAKKVSHSGPSSIDARTVMRSHSHPRFKRFALDCGVPDIFAEFMIDCARALGEGTLRSLMQSTFISYGGPDEKFAGRLHEALRAHGVVTFYFPESATPGERIDAEVYRHLQRFDRVLLICSKASLNRPGVLHEIRETLDREAKDGGATYLLPVTIDDYLFKSWPEVEPELAERLSRRVVGDFRGGTSARSKKFDVALARVLRALKVKVVGL